MPRIKPTINRIREGGIAKLKEESKKEIIKEECAICIDKLRFRVQLMCKHKFCSECIFQWIHKSKKNTCPCCRAEIRPGIMALIKLPYACYRIKQFMDQLPKEVSHDDRYAFFMKWLMAFYSKFTTDHNLVFNEEQVKEFIKLKFPRVATPGTRTLWRVAFPWHKSDEAIPEMAMTSV